MIREPSGQENTSPKLTGEQAGPDVSTLSVEVLVLTTNNEIKDAADTVRRALIGNGANEEHIRASWAEYGRIVEAYVDSLVDTPENPTLRAQAQIAAIINKALIFFAAGNTTRYLEELDSAETYAGNEGFNAVSAFIDTEISSQLELLDLSPEVIVLKLRGVISDSNREFLRDLVYEGADMQDVIGSAYGMILEEGEDPDEVLPSLGITD